VALTLHSKASYQEVRPNAVIFDVDGTLCDVRAVRHWVQGPDGRKRSNANFDAFHEASAACPPFESVRELVRISSALGLQIVVVTGREAKWDCLTARWLLENCIPYAVLCTRGHRDYRPDHIVKAEILLDLRREYDVVLAVDDRPDIVRVWLADGIPTIQVGPDGKLAEVVVPEGAEMNPAAIALSRAGRHGSCASD
jgi:beta-phosphoglucomutase-like phosphatase (HAD superfamily)